MLRRIFFAAVITLAAVSASFADALTVTNVAGLATARPGHGDIVTTLGQTTAGDGGSRTYRYDRTSAAAIDGTLVVDGPGSIGRYLAMEAEVTSDTAATISADSAFTLQAFDGTTPKRITLEELKKTGYDVISVVQHGADGSDAIDDTGAIQAAMDAATASGKVLYLPPGTYIISATLTVDPGTLKFQMFGAGRGSTIIDCTALTNTPALDVSNSTFTHLHDFKMLGDASSGHAIHGVDPDWQVGTYLPQHCQIERMWITGFTGQQVMSGVITGGTTPANDVTIPACGILMAGGLEVHVVDCVVADGDIGIYMFTIGQPKVIRTITSNNQFAGIVDQNSELANYDGCDILATSETYGTSFNLIVPSARRVSATMQAAAFITTGSRGVVLQKSKLKNNYTAIVAEADAAPLITDNWIRADVAAGIHAYGPVRVINNTFDPVFVSPTTFTTNFAVDDKLDAAGHTFLDGEPVVLWSTANIPAGLFANTVVYVVNRTANDFEVSATPGGAALDITDDGTGAHSVSRARRDIISDLPDGTPVNAGVITGNVFGYGGGGLIHANVHLKSVNNSYPVDGLIEGNYFGSPDARANATRLSFPVLATGVTRNLAIRNNVLHIPTGVTIVSRYGLPDNGVAPGPQLENNVSHTVGGSVLFADILPANAVYTIHDANVKTDVGGVKELGGTGDPNTVVTAPVGSRFWRRDGGASTTLYVKESGTGNTGWVAHGPGGGGLPPDADYGDIAITGGVWTIDAGVVTYAKLQDVSATDRILGRDTAGAGDVEEITPAALLTMLNVEAGADVTDATNVEAAGAVMVADTTVAGFAFVVDEDTMVSDSATLVPTQQSVKAYVDAQAGGNAFETIAFTNGQTSVVAASATDTLTLVEGTGIDIASNPATDTITLSATSAGDGTFTTLTPDSATPTVTGLRLVNTANTVGTNYTNFVGGVEGDLLEIHVNDANTSFTNNSNIALAGGVNIPASASPYKVILRRDATQWTQIGYQSMDHQFSTSADGTDNLTLANSVVDADIDINVLGTAGVIRMDVAGSDRFIVDNAGVDVAGILDLNGVEIRTGTGDPNAVVTGDSGDIFIRTDGGAGTSAYIKEDDADNDTWTAFSFGGGGLPAGGTIGDLIVNTGSGTGAWSSVLSVGAAGTTITSGTVATSIPAIAITQTWDDGAGDVTYDAFDINVTNVASNAASRLINLRFGGTSQFTVTTAGVATATRFASAEGQAGFTGADNDTGLYIAGGIINTVVNNSARFTVNNTAVGIASTQFYGISSTASASGAADVKLFRDAAGQAAFRNDTTAQSLRLYNSFVNLTTTYERLNVYAQAGDNFRIHTEDGSGTGAGTDPRGLALGTDETDRLIIAADGTTSTFTTPVQMLRSVEASTQGTGAPNVLTSAESHKVVTNTGITEKNFNTLPAAAAGLTYTFVVNDADGVRATAVGDDTIRLGNKLTAAAGFVESTTIGDTVTLVAISATEWVATSVLGTWTDGTFTFTLVSGT